MKKGNRKEIAIDIEAKLRFYGKSGNCYGKWGNIFYKWNEDSTETETATLRNWKKSGEP